MRVLLAIGFLTVFVMLTPDSNAATCEQHAANCMKNGGTKDKCYGAGVTTCKRTCAYVGHYSGKTFTATSGCSNK